MNAWSESYINILQETILSGMKVSLSIGHSSMWSTGEYRNYPMSLHTATWDASTSRKLIIWLCRACNLFVNQSA